MKKLSRYKEKRRFDRTPEPAGVEARSPYAKANGGLFVIQKHRATRLHYDVRLELDGVLVSWAVPKGPSLDPKARRLAVHVEDHPLEYRDFEGVIPKGNYGAGEVIVWDQGTWEWTPTPGKTKAKSAKESLRKGRLDFTVESEKLGGRFVIVRTSSDEKSWMLIKVKDEHARPGSDVEAERPESVLTGRRVEELKEGAPGEARWSSEAGLEVPEQRKVPDLEKLLGREPPRAKGDASALEPMLPTLVEHLPAGDAGEGWLCEIKLDGIRALASKSGDSVRLVSRNGNDVTRTFPEVVRAIERLPAGDLVLDTEICVLDAGGRSRFQLIQPRLQVASERAIERLARERPAVAFAFDLLRLEGRDLARVPLETRKKVLEALLPEADERLRYLSHFEGRAEEFLAVACENELEGIVVKRPDSRYAPGRTRLWLKLKCAQTGRFVIGGYVLHSKTAKSSLAGLLLGRSEDGGLRYMGGVGTGFDEKLRRSLRERLDALATKKSPFTERIPKRERGEKHVFVKPELSCTVHYTEITDEGKIRHPSFVGLSEPEAGPRPKLTNLGKVFWPEEGYTKGDLLAYYEQVAPTLLPHTRDRPMVLRRMPEGYLGPSFYQKNAKESTPDWVRTVKLWSKETRRFIHYMVVDDVATLLYVIQLGCISLSPWSSRIESLDEPDFSILDLDPGDDCPFEQVIEVALLAREILGELGLRGYCKTSGATGLHVQVPLASGHSYEDARTLAELVARTAEKRRPDLVTTVRTVKSRPKDRVYFDYLQNIPGKTVACVYSVREKPHAPVSTPLRWEEVRRGLRPERFTIANMKERLDAVGDLWLPMLEDRQALTASRSPLRRKRAA